jgi:hypothetical protein
MIQNSSCKCQNPKANYLVFDKKQIGIDTKNGRYGEVSIVTCKTCGSKWLHYFVEYESFSRSGRWYRTLITQELVSQITPENAGFYLNNATLCFAGGSYFNSNGFVITGEKRLDL